MLTQTFFVVSPEDPVKLPTGMAFPPRPNYHSNWSWSTSKAPAERLASKLSKSLGQAAPASCSLPLARSCGQGSLQGPRKYILRQILCRRPPPCAASGSPRAPGWRGQRPRRARPHCPRSRLQRAPAVRDLRRASAGHDLAGPLLASPRGPPLGQRLGPPAARAAACAAAGGCPASRSPTAARAPTE